MSVISKVRRALRNPRLVILELNKLRIENIITHNHKNSRANFFFIQIGSGDGITGDPIYKFVTKYKWNGILVEPVSHLFKKLKSTYDGFSGLIFENFAIAEKEGYKDFYRIEENEEPNNPPWYDQLGSFNRSFVIKQKNRIPNFDKYFIKEKIRCITFSSLLEKHTIKKIDLLHIDTESYDWEIIKTINFNQVNLKMILYEHEHLSDEDRNACIKLLRKKGYKIIVKSGDTFAYL